MIYVSICALRLIPTRRFSEDLLCKSAIESANSIAESDNSATDSVIVCQLSVLYMLNILKLLESADRNGPTIAVSRQWVWALKAGSNRKDYERIKLKTG